jgi:adenosylhomocysteine nucleosidase
VNLLFVAANPMEFNGILDLMRPRRVLLDLKWSRRGVIAGNDVLLTANGAGGTHAAAAVDTACRDFPADAVINTGFCGACDPRLRVGDAIVATEVRCDRPPGSFAVAKPERFAGLSQRGAIASVDHVVHSASEKAELARRGAIAVEMEAAGVAAAAERHNLPFYCIRAVTDPAGEDMANDFNSALRADGQFDTMRIFSHALRHPVTRLPELFRLRQNCLRAARTLGEFFADCRF